MPGRRWFVVGFVCLSGNLVLCAQTQSQNPTDSKAVFSSNVAPIFARSCLSCHGPAQQMSQLDLSTRAAALKGGQKSGAALIAGDSARSPL